MKRIHYLFYKQHFCEWSVFNLVSCNTLLQEYYIYKLFRGDMAKVTIEDNIVHTCMNLRLEKMSKKQLYLFHFEEIKEIKYQIWKKIISFLILLLLQRVRVYIVVLPTALVLNVNLATYRISALNLWKIMCHLSLRLNHFRKSI